MQSYATSLYPKTRNDKRGDNSSYLPSERNRVFEVCGLERAKEHPSQVSRSGLRQHGVGEKIRLTSKP